MAFGLSTFERRMLPFVAMQGLVSTLGGFGGVFTYAQGGTAATVRYVAVMLTVIAFCMVLPYALGRVRPVRCERLAQAAFAVPGVLLWFAGGRPDVLGLAFGAFVGFGWGARHWLELNLLQDAERDTYASHATVLTVSMSLLALLSVTLLLHFNADRERPVLALYALLCLAGTGVAGSRLPATASIRLMAPWAVLSQPGFRACLPLYFLESGLMGVGLVMGASGAVQALGQASRYGWVATVATVAGAVALFALRHQRRSHNRVRWMGLACAGMSLAFVLLGASAAVPALYVLHLVLQAAVGPSWSASEQVLNQRTMDIHGAVSDRIVARESALWLFRIVVLGAFWFGGRGLPEHMLLMLGAGLMALATVLEFMVGRAWLKRAPVLRPTTAA